MRRIPTEQRRQELIAAAIRVISRDGVAAATTRAIVAEAGMPLGAFHYVFGSRDELIAAVIQTVTDGERVAAEIRSLEPGSPLTPEAVVLRGLNGYIDLLRDDPGRELALLELALVAVRHDGGTSMSAQYATYYRAAAGSLRYAAQLTGAEWTTPVEELARHLVTVIDGITTTWLADRDTAAARRTAAFAAAALAAHAGPAPRHAARTAGAAADRTHPDPATTRGEAHAH